MKVMLSSSRLAARSCIVQANVQHSLCRKRFISRKNLRVWGTTIAKLSFEFVLELEKLHAGFTVVQNSPANFSGDIVIS